MRLAHLSDPHLLSLEGSRVRDFLNKRWIGGANLLLKRARQHSNRVFEGLIADIEAQAVDHVLCTGDITNLSLVSEMRFAAEMFARFGRAPDDITALPGNHDAYVAAGADLYPEQFGQYFASDPGWGQNADAPWPVVRVRGEVAIVGLSTSLVTPWFRAWGRVGVDQRTRLDEILSDPRLDGKLRLVALHHPPVGKPARSRGAGLRDHAALARVLATRGAELVLHGHEHMDLVAEIPRDQPDQAAIPVRGIQSATFVGRNQTMRASYRIYEALAPAPAAEGTKPTRPLFVREELRSWNLETEGFEAATCAR